MRRPKPYSGRLRPLLNISTTGSGRGYPVSAHSRPDKEDPSTITDFNGHIGLAYVVGMGTHTDQMTGDVSHLPYEVDLRFMKGVYVGKDLKIHHGTFALI